MQHLNAVDFIGESLGEQNQVACRSLFSHDDGDGVSHVVKTRKNEGFSPS
jgi:hypothetical protein